MLSAPRLQAVSIPAGTYAVGDPGNLLDDPDLDDLLTKVAADAMAHTLASGKRVVLMSTSGDGWLLDDQGGTYAIDSGCLAVVPLADPVSWQVVEAVARGSVTLHHFKDEAMVAGDGKAFRVGGLTITRP